MFVGEPNGASVAASSSGAFDLAGLLARCMDDAAMAAGLLERFTSRLPVVVQEIESSIAASQWSQAASKAHMLKGEAGSLGAAQLQAAAGTLEQSLGRSRPDAVAEHLVQLKAAAHACLRARGSALEQLNQGAVHAPQPW